MTQGALFHESITDALVDVVRALGGAKKVGVAMRPEKSVDEAARWLLDCLNPDRPARLDPDQVLWLICRGREVGCHSIVAYINQAAHYEAPRPIEPEDERAKLQRDFVQAVDVMQKLAKQLERAGVAPSLKAVG